MFQTIIEGIRAHAPWRRHRGGEATVLAPETEDAAPPPATATVADDVASLEDGGSDSKAPSPVEEFGTPEALRRTLARRIDSIRVLHASHPGNEDALKVLDRLGAPGAVIRQPPVAAQAVLTLSRRPYGADQMTRLIERDPALTQSLLRHANSAWYGGSAQNPILALKPAIQRVGTQGIHATVMFEVVQGELSRPGGGFDPWARMVWEHMVRAAPIARDLAGAFGVDGEEAFTLALLHDVGKLVVFDRVASERKHLRRDLRITGIFMSDVLARLHEILGGLALLEWGLEAEAAAVVADHHRQGPSPSDSPFSEVVYLAERIDLALHRKAKVDMDFLWRDGKLKGPRQAVESWLASDDRAARATA